MSTATKQDAIAIVSAFGRRDAQGLELLMRDYETDQEATELMVQIMNLTYGLATMLGAITQRGPDELLTAMALSMDEGHEGV